VATGEGVREEVTAPGRVIAVGPEPAAHHAHEDAHVATRDAFDDARCAPSTKAAVGLRWRLRCLARHRRCKSDVIFGGLR
jgi:hypothetical protein